MSSRADVSSRGTPEAVPEPDGPQPSVLGPEHRSLTIGIVASILIFAFEGMAVATAMPVAVRELHGLAAYSWAFGGFLTTSLFGMVLAGESCDSHGPRRSFLAGVGGFAVGLVLAGTAQTMPVFVLGRGAQGLGMGMSIVSLYVVVARAYPEAMRPRVFSAMSAAWVLPSIVGPALSGWVTQVASWRLVFLAVPLLVVPALALMLPRLVRIEGPGGDPGVTRRGRRWFALSVAGGAALLQYAGQHIVWSSLLLGAAGLALIVPTLPRLLPDGTLFARRGLPAVVLMRGILAGSFFGAESFVPLMLVTQRSLSPTLAGLSLTGGALGWFAGSWYQSRPSLRTSRARLIQVGSGMVALGIAGMATALAPAVPTPAAGVGWVMAGAGMGMGMASVSVLLLEMSDPGMQGINSAAVQISDALGGVVFIGVAGALFAALHRTASTLALALIFATMVAVALVGTLVARRIVPRHTG
jgi:MFS family permease